MVHGFSVLAPTVALVNHTSVARPFVLEKRHWSDEENILTLIHELLTARKPFKIRVSVTFSEAKSPMRIAVSSG